MNLISAYFWKMYSVCTCTAVLKYGTSGNLQAMGLHSSKKYFNASSAWISLIHYWFGISFVLFGRCDLRSNYTVLSFPSMPPLHWPMNNSLHFWIGDVVFPVSELKHFVCIGKWCFAKGNMCNARLKSKIPNRLSSGNFSDNILKPVIFVHSLDMSAIGS